ncbi:hypothetical protein BH18ACI4_BH18ACI4_00760 [soil metagenome]
MAFLAVLSFNLVEKWSNNFPRRLLAPAVQERLFLFAEGTLTVNFVGDEIRQVCEVLKMQLPIERIRFEELFEDFNSGGDFSSHNHLRGCG